MNERKFRELHLGTFKPDDSYESVLKRVKGNRSTTTAEELYTAHRMNKIKDAKIAELEKELADYQIQGVEGFVKFCKQDPRLSGLDKLQIHSMAIAFKQALKEQGE